MAHTYNTSDLGGRDKDDHDLKQVRKKRPTLSKNKLGIAVHVCGPSYSASRNKRISHPAWAKV
jgi:hypothetical protein